jgi:prepilin-type processing-associated H-X9-DG protein
VTHVALSRHQNVGSIAWADGHLVWDRSDGEPGIGSAAHPDSVIPDTQSFRLTRSGS